MKVIGIQYDIAWEHKSANFDKINSMLGNCVIDPGNLIVLPEMYATGFSMNVEGIHEGEEKASESFMQAMAKQYKVYVLGGVVCKTSSGRGLNEACLFSPRGDLMLRYPKIHPFSYAGETNNYDSGVDIKLFDWGDFKCVPFICYDLRFPEIFRHATVQGATLFLIIANWPAAREAHWITLLQARAIENQTYVVGINRCGKDPNLAYSGRSMVIDPRGNVLIDAGNDETVLEYELDVNSLKEYRAAFPALYDIHYNWLGLEKPS